MTVIRAFDIHAGGGQLNRYRPLLSHSTILILSGVLLGMTFQGPAVGPMQSFLFAGGAIGLISFVALRGAAQWRRQRRIEVRREQVSRRLERRLRRHIPPAPHMRARRKGHRNAHADSQYVTVVTSKGMG